MQLIGLRAVSILLGACGGWMTIAFFQMAHSATKLALSKFSRRGQVITSEVAKLLV
jgi:hypothetical protein